MGAFGAANMWEAVFADDGSTTYYRDENQVHYVPKRSLEDVLV